MLEASLLTSTQSSATWVKSRRCESSACVEAAVIGDQIAVRNSTSPDGPIVTFSMQEWRAFLGGVQDGDFDFDS
jgi:Domain of unknown function (DUF397)